MTAPRPTGRAPHGTLGIDVALAPSLLPPVAHPRVYIAVDVIRATTTLSVLCDQGCQAARVVRTVAEAREARARGIPGLLVGEAGGLRPDGFDLGNSPREAATAPVATQDIIFATTNGTRALHACADAGADAIFAGSFRNATALAEAAVSAYERALAIRRSGGETDSENGSQSLTEERPEDVANIVVVCAGLGGRPALDDTLCSGYLAERIASVAAARGILTRLLQGARIATLALHGFPESTPLSEKLADAPAARLLASVGLGDDVAWCAEVDVSRSVPAVVMPSQAGEPLLMRAATDE